MDRNSILNNIFNNFPIGIMIIDEMGKIIEINDNLIHILEINNNDTLKNLDLFKLIPEFRKDNFNNDFKKIMVDASEDLIELEFRIPSGKQLICNVKFSQIPQISPETNLNVIYFLDYQDLNRKIINENEEIEKINKENREIYKFMSKQALIGILILQNGLVKYVNDTAAKIIEEPINQIRNWNENEYLNLFYFDDLPRVFEQATKKQTGDFDNVINHYIYRFFTKTGKIKWIENFSQTIIYQGKTADLLTFIDITERINIEENLAEEREILSITLKTIGDAIITANNFGNIIMINDQAVSLTGYSHEFAKGKHISKIFKIFDENSQEEIENITEKVLARRNNHQIPRSVIYFNKFGNKMNINITISPILNKKDEIIGIIIVFRDLTLHRKMERLFFDNQRLESVGLLAGGIAHDFNNLLTSILGNLSVLRLDLIEMDESKELINSVIEAENATIRARDLTKQLLTFSKGGAPLKKISNIGKIIKETTEFTLRGTKHEVIFNIDPNLWHANIDRGQIGQVIQNLIINANQAITDEGKIEIFAKNVFLDNSNIYSLDSGQYISVSIKDNGSGITKEDLNKIFDLFYTTKAEGSGLGLSVSHSIIKKHNGEIVVDSEFGKGSIFTFFIPASTLTSEKEKEDVKKIVSESKTRGKVLVLEDDYYLAKVLGSMLNRLGFDYILTSNCDSTINEYKSSIESGDPFSLVISDLTIPGGKGGVFVIKELTKINPDVKAIISSGYANSDVLLNFRNYGFKSILIKPYSLTGLSESIEKALKE